MIASDYPITFPYGATTPPYGTPSLPYHRGVDRTMPQGTEVKVNNVTIGLSGNTGLSTGAHLHIGRFINGKDTNPGNGGFWFASAVVSEIGEDPTDGKFVRIQGDGASWVYLHLSDNSKVKLGQVLKGDSVSTVSDTEIDQMSWTYFGYGASQEFIKEHRGEESNTFERFMFEHPQTKAYKAQVQQWRTTAEQSTAGLTELKPGRYLVK